MSESGMQKGNTQMSQPTEQHWQTLLGRLSRAVAVLDQTLDPTESRTRELLDERAKLMALAVTRSRSEELNLEVLLFFLGSQRCGISTRFVFEMLSVPAIAKLPGTAPHILGVCSVRGQILLVVDLAQLFGFTLSASETTPQLLVVGKDRPEFGVICQGYGQTARLAKSAISHSPELSEPPLLHCAAGMTADGMLLIDGKELLKDSRLFVNQSG